MSNQQEAEPQPLSRAPEPSPEHSPQRDGRSEALLPADGPDPNLEVAEEVSLDLQSDSTRRIGSLPPDTPVAKPAEALAASLAPGARPDQPNLDSERLNEAIERCVPPSG